MTSVRSVELEKIEKYDAGMSHGRQRDQKQVRNVSSDVPVTFCGDWRHLNAIFRKFAKLVTCCTSFIPKSYIISYMVLRIGSGSENRVW